MDPPLVNEASFTAAANPSSYSLAGLLSFPTSGGGLGLRTGSLGGGRGDVSIEVSTVTEQSGGRGGAKRRRDVGYSLIDASSKLVSTSSTNRDLSESNAKRREFSGSSDENSESKREVETNSGNSIRPVEEKKNKPEPPKDYIHVRARRGQATDSHSLAERARREKISERMKILQDLVPGCNKVIGKALVLDEIINYIQSLQHQVEFLSMKLEAVNSRLTPSMEGFHSKDLAAPAFDVNGMIYGSQTPVDYAQRSQAEWLHMQVGSGFQRAT